MVWITVQWLYGPETYVCMEGIQGIGMGRGFYCVQMERVFSLQWVPVSVYTSGLHLGEVIRFETG